MADGYSVYTIITQLSCHEVKTSKTNTGILPALNLHNLTLRSEKGREITGKRFYFDTLANEVRNRKREEVEKEKLTTRLFSETKPKFREIECVFVHYKLKNTFF